MFNIVPFLVLGYPNIYFLYKVLNLFMLKNINMIEITTSECTFVDRGIISTACNISYSYDYLNLLFLFRRHLFFIFVCNFNYIHNNFFYIIRKFILFGIKAIIVYDIPLFYVISLNDYLFANHIDVIYFIPVLYYNSYYILKKNIGLINRDNIIYFTSYIGITGSNKKYYPNSIIFSLLNIISLGFSNIILGFGFRKIINIFYFMKKNIRIAFGTKLVELLSGKKIYSILNFFESYESKVN